MSEQVTGSVDRLFTLAAAARHTGKVYNTISTAVKKGTLRTVPNVIGVILVSESEINKVFGVANGR